MIVAAAWMGIAGAASAQTGRTKPVKLPAIKAGAHTSFDALKQIDAGMLNIGYAEAGRAEGPVVLLLHGWPYDIHSYVDVAPLLASAGWHRGRHRRSSGTSERSSGNRCQCVSSQDTLNSA